VLLWDASHNLDSYDSEGSAIGARSQCPR
jgi:hypothetical protein